MLTRQLRNFRDRFHPLHHLWRNRFVAETVLPRLDVPVARRLHGIDWPVWVRRVRHAAYIVDSRIVEPGELALFAVLCRAYRPRIFWDVGANMGHYSWLFLSADPTAAAILFEPDPDNLALIDRTIANNSLDRATVRRCAVSDSPGDAVFSLDTKTGHTGHLGANQIRRAGTIRVPTVTLDSTLVHTAPPDIIKIDVEGAEMKVFAGAAGLIRTHRPIILFECFEWPNGAAAILADVGYQIFNGEDPDKPIGDAANFLALPRERAADIQTLRCGWRDELSARGF
jgi:FkbM family methyltransferase